MPQAVIFQCWLKQISKQVVLVITRSIYLDHYKNRPCHYSLEKANRITAAETVLL